MDEVTYSARGRGDREQEIVKTISFRGCIAMAGLCHGGMLDGKRYFLDQRKSQGKSRPQDYDKIQDFKICAYKANGCPRIPRSLFFIMFSFNGRNGLLMGSIVLEAFALHPLREDCNRWPLEDLA